MARTNHRGEMNGYSREDIHKRLDDFLDQPTLRGALEALVSGLVNYELRVRLKETLPQHD